MPNRYDSDSDIDEETYLKLKKIKKKENKVKSLVTPVSSRKRVAESDGSDSDSSSSSSSDGEDPRGKSEHGQIDSDTESGTKSPRYDNFKTDRREGGRRRRERKSRSRERSRSRDQRKSNRERSIERRDRIERRKREYEREVEMRKSQREKRHKERQEAEEKEEDERRKKREERHKEREEAASKRKETESKERDENVTNSTEKFHKRKRDETHETSSKENEDKADDPGNMEAYLKSKRTKVADEALTTRTGGAYIPPARLRMMQQQIKDKAGKEFQRLSWEALKKSINGLVNKVNVSNIIMIVRQLFQENIVRGRGLLSRSIIQAQTASPTFTHVYASLVAIINTKFPNIGELILKRCILNFKKGFRRNDKANCISSTRFIAHLVNQQVVNELLALQVLYLLLSNPTDDSVEVAVGFLKECGSKLTDVSPRGINAIFEELRRVLHENKIEQRTKYMVEVMFAVRKDGFKDHQSVIEELDLVEDEDQITHMIKLDDEFMSEDILNVFKFDPNFENNEEEYKKIKKEILDEGSSDESGDNSGADSSDSSSDEEGEVADGEIIDQTETNLVAFRRTVYLTIQSSLDFEECAHKIMKMEIKPGYEEELCSMILDCCAQQRTYEKFFGLLAQRFCSIDRKYIGPLQKIFRDQYETIHRLETNKLRNVAKFFAHLLHTDAISWEVLQSIKLNEDDTTSSSRIFIKIMIQELSEYLGLPKLNDRLKDVTLQPYFEGLFPRDNPRNTRFAINFFTSIGLGGLTDELRSHLKNMPKPAPKVVVESSSASSSSSSDSDSDSSSSSSSSNSSSDDDAKRKKKQTSREAKGKSTKIKNNKENSVENGVELDSLWYQRKELQKQKEKEQKQKRRDRDTYKSRDKESDSRYAMRELSIDDKSPPRNSKKHKKKDRHVPTSSDSDSSVEEEVNVRHSKYKEIETRVVRVSKKKDKKSRDHKEYDDEQHSGRGSGRDNAKYATDKSDRVKEKSSQEGDGRSRNREYSRERTRHRDGSRERRR